MRKLLYDHLSEHWHKQYRKIITALSLTAIGLTGIAQAQDPVPNGGPGGNWEYLPQYSTEFDGNTLDTSKYTTNITSWGRYWSWESDNVTVADGNLNVEMEHRVHDFHDDTPNGWNQSVSGGTNSHATYVTTYNKRSGESALTIGEPVHAPQYDATLSQRLTGLTNGTYTLTFWALNEGSPTAATVSVTGLSGGDLTQNIAPSTEYAQYTINSITVTHGSLNVVIHGAGPGGSHIRLDDLVLVRDGTTNNLLTNGDFETRNSKNYVSGAIRSNEPILYGYFEARLKTSLTPGTSSAFWLFRADPAYWDELDILESGQSLRNRNLVEAARHKLYPLPRESGLLGSSTLSNIETTYHTYAMEWDETQVRIYYDGTLVNTHDHTNFTNPMDIVFSIGLRAPYKNNPTAVGFPTVAEVDYIRVWQRPTAGIPIGNVIALRPTAGAANEWLTVNRSQDGNVESQVGTASPTTDQQFVVVDAGSNGVGLRPVSGSTGEYVGIQFNTPNNNTKAWVPRFPISGSNSWNSFEWINLGGNTVAFHQINGTVSSYLGVVRGSDDDLNSHYWVPATTPNPSDWQTFIWTDLGPAP